MPFIAKHKGTGERIDITEIENPRSVLHSGDCLCPFCGEPFILKAGMIITAHFAHKSACNSDWIAHPQSAEHNAGKLFLKENLPSLPEYKDARIEFEVGIVTPSGKKRVADVLVTLPMGWQIAHEVQLASITVEELEARTNDYNEAGIDVVWWLGKSAAKPANENWCHEVFGFCVGLEFTRLSS